MPSLCTQMYRRNTQHLILDIDDSIAPHLKALIPTIHSSLFYPEKKPWCFAKNYLFVLARKRCCCYSREREKKKILRGRNNWCIILTIDVRHDFIASNCFYRIIERIEQTKPFCCLYSTRMIVLKILCDSFPQIYSVSNELSIQSLKNGNWIWNDEHKISPPYSM